MNFMIRLFIAVIILVIIGAVGYKIATRERLANNRRRVYLHYTNWCGACKSMKPVWDQVKSSAGGVTFIEVDEDKAKNEWVRGYPTIIMVNERGQRIQYDGGANYGTLLRWVLSPVHM
jgi:thiol-disulfide isomerase/thioredoxin